MVEEMQKTCVQSQRDTIAVQFENDTEALEKTMNAFRTLQTTVRRKGVFEKSHSRLLYEKTNAIHRLIR